MKKNVLLLFMAWGGLMLGGAQAQIPQVNNSGFETWTDLGTGDEEPTEWNSFQTADGTWSTFAAQQIKRSTVIRPGSSGSYSSVIWARSAAGTIANGNMTTGRIRMGSTTPSSTNNYNRSVLSDNAFHEHLGGFPDSLVVWVRPKISNTSHQPRIHAIIHNDGYDVRDPLESGSTNYLVGEATMNITPVNNVWTRLSIPFNYSGYASNNPVNILISITTCKDPGVGTAGDSLYIDDLQLIYNPASVTAGNTPDCDFGSVTVTSSKNALQTFDLCDNAGTVLDTWTGTAASHTFAGLASGTYRGKSTWYGLVSALSSSTTLSNTPTPIATTSNTPDCSSGTVTVSSNQTGVQTFDLCDNGGAVLQSWTGNAGSHDFTALADGTYKGKVTMGSCESVISTATVLSNYTFPAITSQPENDSICETWNTSYALTADVNASGYQWQVNSGSGWNNITLAGTDPVYGGWDAATLTLTGVGIGNNGNYYRCIVHGQGASCDVISDSALLMVDLCTGIEDQQTQDFNIYPNPFNNQLNLDVPSTSMIMVELFAMDGRLLMSSEMQGSFQYQIHAEDLQEGIYLLKISSENSISTYKLIKNK